MKIPTEELHFEQWPKNPIGGIPGKVYPGVKVTHRPSGMTYSTCEHGNERKNKAECVKQITKRVEWLQS